MHLSPFQLARENRTLTLDVPLDALPRFALLVAPEGDVIRVEVQFERDEQGRCHMQGRLRTKQRFLCANCREVETCDMDVEVDACLLGSDDAARDLIGEVDPLVIEGPEATPAELFEDDLLLALPERPCYGSETCPHRVKVPEDEVPEQPRDNPFAVLAELKDGSQRRED